MSNRRTPLEILEQSCTIAVVGISTSHRKEANRVPRALASIGFVVVGVHPTATEIDGITTYPSLDAIPNDVEIDVVDVFRPPAEIPEVMRSASARGASAVWTQIGIMSTEARTLAKELNLDFVESQCMATTSAMNDIDKTGQC